MCPFLFFWRVFLSVARSIHSNGHRCFVSGILFFLSLFL
jgi:hypothetical protein